MISVGDRVPPIDLNGPRATDGSLRALDASLGQDCVLLVFCPGDLFTKNPRAMGPLSYIPWFQFHKGVRSWLVTNDEDVKKMRRRDNSFLELPILTDGQGVLTSLFDIPWQDREPDPSSVSLVLIDQSLTVRFVRDSLALDEITELRHTIADLRPPQHKRIQHE